MLFAAALVVAPVKAQQGIQFPPGSVFGNDTAAQRTGRAASLSLMFDRALGSADGMLIARTGGLWGAFAAGTGVQTALGVNVGTVGSFVVNGGALGSPSSVGTFPAFTSGTHTITGNEVISGLVNMNGAAATNPGEIWSTNSVNNLLSWKLTNTSTGTAASTAVTVGNSAGTMDLAVWSTTFSNAFFTNMAGLIVGSNNAGMLLTTVGAAHPIVFGVNNVENARFDGSNFTLVVPVKTPGGSAVSPGVRVGIDGYGIYVPGANQLGMTVAGVNLFDYNITNANTFSYGGPIIGQSSIKSTFGGGGIGYATGAGGAVTQITSRTTTTPAINKVTGQITLFGVAGSASPVTFTVANTTIKSTDTVQIVQVSGTDRYRFDVTKITDSTSFDVTMVDLTGTTNEAPVINFTIMRGVNN